MTTRTGMDGWTYDPPRPCGGISVQVNGGAWTPVSWCEVHMMPWGHLAPGDTQ